MEYFCKKCNKQYASYQSLWNHKNTFHVLNEKGKKEKEHICKFCYKEFNNRQTKWRHEKTCNHHNETSELKNKIEKIEKDMEKLKTEPKIIAGGVCVPFGTITNNNTTNNTTNNIQYIINSPTESCTSHLTFEDQKDILDKGLNSLGYLIEMINFNKSVPENHSYCVTAINDKHASVIDEKTNKIIKTDKIDLFDKVLVSNLQTLEKIANNPIFSQEQHDKYKGKIGYLREIIFQNEKFMKRYQNDINILSYNNKEMVKDTWKKLKEVDKVNVKESNYKVMGFDDLVKEIEKENNIKIQQTKSINEYDSSDSELSESDTESNDSECEETIGFVEIIINNKKYIIEDNKLYSITKTHEKGKLFGIYVNGKIKKINAEKEIDL
jgi:hypothetical protein